jgi:hypothetical protein
MHIKLCNIQQHLMIRYCEFLLLYNDSKVTKLINDIRL